MIRRFGIRLKALVVLLPIVVLIVGLSGVASASAARAGMLRLATRLLAYKTEQIRDFAFSQWQVLEELGYADDPAYLNAAQAAMQSYAGSLIRAESERVFAIGREGEITLATSLIEFSSLEIDRLLDDAPAEGWFETRLGSGEVVGQSFRFEPFGWRFFVVDDGQSFYRDVRTITVYHAYLLAGALAFTVAAVLLLTGFAMRPIEQLAARMGSVSASLDFSGRVPVQSSDEIGELSGAFNLMSATVEVSHEHLVAALQAEQRARSDTAVREEETLHMLGAATEFRDTETGSHIVRVGLLARYLSELIGETEEYQELMRKAAPLHDLGKIGIPDSILLKPGPLTRDEFKQMEVHTTIGWRILNRSQSKYLSFGAEIALTHHEQWDGSGYPAGLAGGDIPLCGRIVRIVDVYDAIRSNRPYKNAQPHDNALAFIRSHRGDFFDPELVDAFVKHEQAVSRMYRENEDPVTPDGEAL